MKKQIFYLLIAVVVIMSCNTKQPVNYAILSGSFTNGEGQNLELYSKFTRISLDTIPSINKKIELDENGSFIDTLFFDGKREFTISKDRSFFRIALQPGSQLNIEADYNNITKNTLTGTSAAYTRYLNGKEQISTKFNQNDRERRLKGIKEDETAFKKRVEEEFNEYLQLLNNSVDFSKEIVAREKQDIHYSKVIKYVYYNWFYKREHGEDAPVLSADFLDIFKATDMQSYSEFQNSVTYQFLLRAYYNSEYAMTAKPNTDPVMQLKMIKKMVTNQNLLDELFIMYGQVEITRTKDVQAYYDYFMANVTNKHYQQHITGQYKDLIATQPGQPAPEFVNYKNVDGGTNSLSDFRGKYVYIDVWATWCGPCKAEIPHLIDVEKKYHDKNIEFVSLSVDNMKSFEKWKKFVKEKELGGVQIIADNEFNSEFVQKFQIKGIPQFILIDPEGKIVAPNAPRPSSPKLIELFNQCGI